MRRMRGRFLKSDRENNFDILRLFGALLVLYGHAYALTGAASPGFAVNGVGTIGVKIFFTISGYLVTLSWLRDPNLFRFFWRRAVRILPGLIGVVLFSIVIVGPLFTRLSPSEYFHNPDSRFYLWNIAFYITYELPGVFEGNIYPNAVNGSLWSLPVELSMYLLVPLLIVPLARFPRVFAVLAIVASMAALWFTAYRPRTEQLVFYASPVWPAVSLLPYFLSGMVFALCWKRAFNIYVAFAGLFVLSVFDMGAPLKETLLVMVLPYAVLSFAVGPSIQRLPRGADLSYGLFLYGFVVEQMLAAMLGHPIGPWKMFALATVGAACLATMSWFFIEKPMLALKPGRRLARGTEGMVSVHDEGVVKA